MGFFLLEWESPPLPIFEDLHRIQFSVAFVRVIACGLLCPRLLSVCSRFALHNDREKINLKIRLESVLVLVLYFESLSGPVIPFSRKKIVETV